MTSQKVFIITGATKGIGLATAQYLQKQGHQVIGIARKKPSDFPGVIFCADLRDADQTEAVIKKIQKKYVVDGVVNNVGNVAPCLEK